MKQCKKYICYFLITMLFTISTPITEIGMIQFAVEAFAATPKLNEESLTLEVGERYVLKLENAKNVKWKSKNKKIAKISSKGNVKAIKKGTTKVYAIYKKKKYYCTVTVTSPKTEEEKRHLLAEETAKKIIQSEGIDKLGSDIEKIEAVHDYIILNATYDYQNYLQDTIPTESYEAYGIIVLNKGVCDGYRKAFQLFMDILEIPCIGVSGTANGVKGWEGHAWNIVTLEGENYHIDLTWDEPDKDTMSNDIEYDYFLLSDEMMKKNHKWTSSTKANGGKYTLYHKAMSGK